jgi:hypothetical protein
LALGAEHMGRLPTTSTATSRLSSGSPRSGGRGADPVREAGLTGEQTGEQIGVEAEKPVG